MHIETSFGQWLKKRRKALGLTQEELAQRVPCAVITLQKLEADQRRPSQQMAERLGEHLGIAAEQRPAFVRFARMRPGARGPEILSPAAPLASWRPWLRPLTNLPVSPTPVIGRDQAVVAVRERLLGDANRLLTLVGPPGVGKTRLAIEAGTNLLDDFGDGVYFVALASVSDPSLVVVTIAQTLGVNETAERSFAAGLKEYLREKHMLLLLDNFEQVVAAAPLVSELLDGCPWLGVLVTSRAPLHVRRERQFPVPPLTVPTGAHADLDTADLMHYSAIALFVERARAVRPAFVLTPENAGAVAAICARLDGLPLAIELVAARIGVLPPQALLEHLGRQQLLHTGELRDLSERHHTLHSAIDWSYTLLRPEEQRLLAWSGVFIGGWTLEAAETVAGLPENPPSVSTLDILASLVNHSLVVQEEHRGEPRFALLETIRAYALERLAERGEEERVRQRHAEYYLALAEEAEPHLRTAGQLPWLDRLEVESANLRAALDWVLERAPDPERGLRLAGALGFVWIMRSHVSEGCNWSTRALDIGEHASPALRAKVLFRAGMLSWPGDLPLALSRVEESLVLYREIAPSQKWEYAHALTGSALIMAYQGDSDAIQSACEEAVALFEELEDRWGVAISLAVLGEAYLLRHDYAGACARFEESLDLFRETGDRWGIGVALMNWGYTDSLQGNLDAARARLEESIRMFREVGERTIRSLSLNVLAQVVQQQGEVQQAVALYRESLDLYQKMGIEASAADVLYNLASLVQSQGHFPLAEKLYGEGLALFSKQGNKDGIAKCRAGLAAVTGAPQEVSSAG